MDALKILVVDDESRMRKLVKDFLTKKNFQVLEAGNGEEAMDIFYKEKDIALLAVGSMVEVAIEIREALKEKGYSVSLVNARFVKPVDEKLLENLNENHRLIVTMEENVLNGGFGERVLRITRDMNLKYKVINVAIPNVYVEHGNIEILKSEIGLDKETILNKIQKNIDMD